MSRAQLKTRKRKPFWKMKAPKDKGEKSYDPELKDNILERHKTRLALWEEHLKDPNVALDKALGQGGVTMSYLCPHCHSFLTGRLRLVGLRGEKSTHIGVRDLWTNITGRTKQALGKVRTGEGVNQAKVFKAHAVPQGLCGNLIFALRLLANPQEDGDGPVRGIVGLTEGL